jgi:ABC-type dipeptide/oligopeptide/nickel transport system permease component
MGEVDRLKPGAGSMQADRPRGLIVLGYLTAILMPPIGFILGIVAVTRPNRWAAKHGVGVIVASIVVPVLWVVLLAAGVHSAVKKTDQELNRSLQTSQAEFRRQEQHSEARLREQVSVPVR